MKEPFDRNQVTMAELDLARWEDDGGAIAPHRSNGTTEPKSIPKAQPSQS